MAAMAMVCPKRGDNETQSLGKKQNFGFPYYFPLIPHSCPTKPCPSSHRGCITSHEDEEQETG
jgi:hypothetical protein